MAATMHPVFSSPKTRLALVTVGLCLLGALGGYAATFTPIPLPWVMGSLALTAALAIADSRLIPVGYEFPTPMRSFFVSLIGILIGAQVTADLFSNPSMLVVSMTAIAAFVPVTIWLNYVIFHRLGGYDPATAYFSAAPGGLIEAITLGEANGADIRILVTQQFLRLIVVVVVVPLGLSVYHGHPVGSAAGITTPGNGDLGLTTLLLIIAISLAGIVLGRVLRLPAGQITGALLLAAILSLTGYAPAMPEWLVSLSQLVIGTALGTRFAGMNRALLMRCLWLSLVSVAVMLGLGALFAWALVALTGQDFEVLFITFAPGGVNEMALIALSLDANPAYVTLHHIFRIVVTVVLVAWGARLILSPRR